jgi:hypothetical protein
MENYQLGRKVVNQARLKPETFNMSDWANDREECGMVACLGGWTMIFSGYEWDGMDFRRPDGTIVHDGYSDEAAYLLGMSHAELWGGQLHSIFYDHIHGLDRFEAIVVSSERNATLEAQR